MAGAARRGYGEDGICFDHQGDCRDSALHKTCAGRWRGVVSLGLDADGRRVRKKVSGQTKAEVKDKLKALHSELDAGVRSAASYTVGFPHDKIATAGFYAGQLLPQAVGLLPAVTAGAGPLFQVDLSRAVLG
jgi:hypothetical protein